MSRIDHAALLRFELRYQWLRWMVLIAAVALSALAVTMVATRYAAAGIPVNAPIAIAQSLGLLSLWALVTQTLFTVHAVLRDREHGFLDLVRAQPAGSTRLLLLRSLVVMSTGALVYAVATIALALAPFVLTDPSRVAPLVIESYVRPYVTLVLPNIVFVTALLVAIATLGRSAMATYVGAVGLFAAYMVTAFAVASPIFAGGAPVTPEGLARAALLDPFGMSAVFEQTRYWTTVERGRDLIAITGRFLINRVLWLAVAVAAGVAAIRVEAAEGRRAARGGRASARQRADRQRDGTDNAAESVAPYRTLTPSTASLGAELRSTLALEVQLLVNSWPIRVLLLGLCIVVAIEVLQNLGAGEYGTRLLPTSATLARRATEPVAVLGVFLLVWLASDVMWRERLTRFNAILDATPQRDGVTLTARLLALLSVIALALCCATLVAIGVQLTLGGAVVEARVYAMHALVTAWPLLLWTIVFGALHAIIGNRWGGLGGGVLIVALYLTGSDLGLEHPMTRFPEAPPLRWSDFDGFGPSWRSHIAFMSYWTVLAIWLLALAWGVRPRSVADTLRQRLRRLRTSDQRSWRLMFAGVSLSTLVAISAMWNMTWAGERWRSNEQTVAWRVGYERQFRALFQRPHPRIVHADLELRLPSSSPRADITGRLRLHNANEQAIDTVWLAFDAEAIVAEATIAGVSAVRLHPRYPMYAIHLPAPLAPGAMVELQYRVRIDRTRPRATGYDRMLTDNGSYLTTDDLLPMLGYQGRFEITDSVTRARFALGAATPQLLARADTADQLARRRREGPPRAWMTSRLVIITDSALRALGTGELRRETIVGADRVAEYVLDERTPPRLAVLTGRYAVQRRFIAGTSVELWYHPLHHENVARILDAASVSLQELVPRFGAYPHRTLRLVELPAGWGFGAFAMPGTLLLTEDRGMRLDARHEGVDLLLRRIGHEVAHQWWGGAVSPADVEGAGLLVEGLAKYSEQRIVASVHGEGALPSMLAYDHDRYLAGRSRESDPERPLSSATYADDYLFYGKAAIAFHALHARLGDVAMTRALRHVLASDGGPFGAATTTTLRHAVDAEAGTASDSLLVAEWLDARRVYDLRIDSTHLERLGDRVQLTVVGHATREDDGSGIADMQLELALRGPLPVASARNPPPVLSARTAENGRFVLRALLDAAPTSVEIDPRLLWIDRNRSNNTRVIGGQRE
jgi:ABC-2 type transport system permease protein